MTLSISHNSWREVMLEDVAAEITVGFVGPMASEYVPSGIPFLRSQNVEPLLINQNDIKFITPEFHQRISKSALSPGDVVIVRTGKPGSCAVMPECLPVSNCSDLVIVRCGDKLDARFLAYYINTVSAHHVSANLVGAVQQHFNVGAARRIKLCLPPLPEQRAIASVLGALDDKIELNRRMNETLEEMAQALFKSSFVDPTANGLPKGWRESTLGDVIEVKHGFAYQGEFFRDERCRDILLTPGNFAVGGGFKEDKFKYYEGPTPDEYVLSEGDLLITMTDLSKAGDTLGYGALVPAAPEGHRFHHNQRLGKVVIQDARIINKPFLYQILRSHEYRAEILGGATGTTVKHTSPGRIKSFKFVLPPAPLMQKYGNVAGAWHELAAHNRKECRTLAALRDTLLPKLLSGELRLRTGPL